MRKSQSTSAVHGTANRLSSERPSSASKAATLQTPGNTATTTKSKKDRNRGNLFEYVKLDAPADKQQHDIAPTPVGITRQGLAFSSRKDNVFGEMNDLKREEAKEIPIPKIALSAPNPVTERFTVYFKGINNNTGINDARIRSGNVSSTAVKKDVEVDFANYWLSTSSCVKPSDRRKIVTLKAEKYIETDMPEESEEEEEQPKVYVESRLERMRRLRQQDIINIDPIAIQLKAEEIKTLTDCKAQYRRSYNDVRRSIERGGAFEPVVVDDSSTIDAETLIGDPKFRDTVTPGEELILSAAANNVGPFFIMEFMKPLLNKDGTGVRFEDVDELDLSTKMLGDEKCLCVAKALKRTPNVKRLSLAGNALTDKSITPILQECLDSLGCTFIDISDNKVDSNSISVLKLSLTSANCTLEELVLSSADIDDDECANFVEALYGNTSLVYLDLSHNGIGKKEEYNSVFPDFTTGGEAISQLLESNHALQALNLSWNHICKDSASKLCASIARNQGLLELNLSYNNIGDVAAQHLAHSLRTNSTLTSLDVSYNMILPRGVMVFSHALFSNAAIRDLNLSGNSIGQLASRCMFRAIRHWSKKKRVLNVRHRGENMSYHDPTLFDRDNPSGKYHLDLSVPYEYTVACWLFEVGNSKPISQFKDIQHFDGKRWNRIKVYRDKTILSSNGQWESNILEANKVLDAFIEIDSKSANGADTRYAAKHRQLNKELTASIRSIGTNLGLKFKDSFTEMVKQALMRTSKTKRSLAHEILKVIFRTAYRLSVDHSGLDEYCFMDKENLVKCFKILGFGLQSSSKDAEDEIGPHNSESRILVQSHNNRRHVHSDNYEVKQLDGETGRKDDNELVDQIHRIEEMETSGREIHLMAERIIAGQNFDGSTLLDEAAFVRMMLTNFTECLPPPANPLIDMSTGQPWVMPQTGKLSFKFICDRMPPSNDEIQSKESFAIFSDAIAVQAVGKKDAKLDALKQAVAGDFYLTYEQAENLLDNFCDSVDAKMAAVGHFLPQMATTNDACRLLSQNLNVSQIFSLRVKLKNTFRALVGNASGHYYLDLSDPVDWHAGQKIAALNSLEKNKALVETPTRDTSQNGNFENFRNSTFNGRPVVLTSTWFINCPTAGRHHFDYVSTSRPVKGIKAITNDVFNNLVPTFSRR